MINKLLSGLGIGCSGGADPPPLSSGVDQPPLPCTQEWLECYYLKMIFSNTSLILILAQKFRLQFKEVFIFGNKTICLENNKC